MVMGCNMLSLKQVHQHLIFEFSIFRGIYPMQYRVLKIVLKKIIFNKNKFIEELVVEKIRSLSNFFYDQRIFCSKDKLFMSFLVFN